MPERFTTDADIENGPERKETPAFDRNSTSFGVGIKMPNWIVTHEVGGAVLAISLETHEQSASTDVRGEA